MQTRSKKRLGELLIERRMITQQHLEEALKIQSETGEMLGGILIRLGYIDKEPDFLPLVAEQYGVPYISLINMIIPKEAIRRLPYPAVKHYQIMPVETENGTLTVAMSKPYDILLMDELKIIVNAKIQPVLASRRDIQFAIKKYYALGSDTFEKIAQSADLSPIKMETVQDLEHIESEATISNFLNRIFLEAYKERATDIHIEPFANDLIVRFRIDGVLQEVNVPKNLVYFKEAINSRIKIMSNLNIAEKRMPQDGRFKMRVGDVNLDFRVSFIPTLYGESVLLRLLTSTQLYSFEELNLTPEESSLLSHLIQKPHGIIFMTGPTGSGKTTTLYACLSRINTVDKKIITIEDPVEYQLRAITQIQINPAIHLTFAKGLRSILRHDPNIIMVGEVRDVETVEIAIRVALTGHLIFSTLHTNDAASGITRLLNMGVEPYLITSTVECFIAQRLVRVICPKCKKDKNLHPSLLQEFGLPKMSKPITVYEGQGCEDCNFTGYFGRRGIFEFLMLNEEINGMILNRANASQIKHKAMELGMRTLRQCGWEKIKAGITTPEEVIRVTQERSSRKLLLPPLDRKTKKSEINPKDSNHFP